MTTETHGYVFALHEGVDLRLPATKLTTDDKIVLVASIARAFKLIDIDEMIRDRYPWAWYEPPTNP